MDPKQAIGPVKSRVRAARYKPENSLVVSSKTIGTNLVFDLTTQNVSRSGMLLSWENGTPIPFIESTILELTIDPQSLFLEKPLSCLGKVVRKQKNKKDGQSHPDVTFGITIVQIDDQDLGHWESCVENLASRTAPLVTQDPGPGKKALRFLKQA